MLMEKANNLSEQVLLWSSCHIQWRQMLLTEKGKSQSAHVLLVTWKLPRVNPEQGAAGERGTPCGICPDVGARSPEPLVAHGIPHSAPGPRPRAPRRPRWCLSSQERTFQHPSPLELVFKTTSVPGLGPCRTSSVSGGTGGSGVCTAPPRGLWCPAGLQAGLG